MDRHIPPEDDPSVAAAQWLCEVGKRPWPKRTAGEPTVEAGGAPKALKHNRRTLNVVLIAVLTVAYLQYFYLDVLLEINSLQSLIVFAQTAADAR